MSGEAFCKNVWNWCFGLYITKPWHHLIAHVSVCKCMCMCVWIGKRAASHHFIKYQERSSGNVDTAWLYANIFIYLFIYLFFYRVTFVDRSRRGISALAPRSLTGDDARAWSLDLKTERKRRQPRWQARARFDGCDTTRDISGGFTAILIRELDVFLHVVFTTQR